MALGWSRPRRIREAPAGTFDSALVAYGWNLNTQAALPVLLECQARGIEFHCAGVLYFGGHGHLFDPASAPVRSGLCEPGAF